MNKRQRIDQFLARQPYTDGIPAAFFQHFEPAQRHGTAAVEAQLDFYRATDMDMMKIMFDDIYPKFAVKNPEDWRHVPDFSPNDPVFTQQIEVADRLVNAVGKETYVFHYTSPQEVEVMMKREYGSSGSIPSVSIVNYQYQLFMNEHGCPTRIIEKYVGESNRSGFNQDVFNLTYTADHRLQKITVKEEDGPGLWESNFRYQNGLLVYWQECEDGEEVETWEIPADVLYPHRYPVTMVNLDLNGLFDLADDDFINLFSMVGLTGKMSDCLMEAAPIDDEDDPGEDVVGYMEPGKVIEKVYKRIRFKELPYDMLPLVYTFDKDQILRKITAERWYEYGEESCEVHVGNQLISESNPHLGYQYEIKNRKWTKKGDEKNVLTVSLEYEP